MADFHKQVQELLAECEATYQRPRSSPLRTAEMILQHGQLRLLLRDLAAYHEGYKTEHVLLTSMVFETLGALTANTAGRSDWMTEIPPGTAPGFRRALNRLIQYMREER
jgi:hypothetical protein